MKIGLFFGSFNPIHNGHLMLANYFLEYTDIQRVWFVVSPQNPFKEDKELLDKYQRLHMVRLAIEGLEPQYEASSIEFDLPKPSYTVKTMAYLTDKYPEHKFVILTGVDNFVTLDKWYNYETLAQLYQFYVFPRKGVNLNNFNVKCKYKLCKAPEIEISSTFIRKSIAEAKKLNFFLPPKVFKYIEEMQFYKKK